MDRLLLTNVTRTYPKAGVSALSGVSLTVCAGEVVAITGPSGSGKSTLLQLMGGLDHPSSGEILYDGRPLSAWGSLPRFRAEQLGFVFQFHHLLSSMTLLENVAAPLLPLGLAARVRRERALAQLAAANLSDRAHFLPASVSGGERQRCAVCRALVNHPHLVLADEPTGNLDSENAHRVMGRLISHAHEERAIVVIATHNPEMARLADRTLCLRDGRIEEE
jgi:putative ABC transport system ATP-binding protein